MIVVNIRGNRSTTVAAMAAVLAMALAGCGGDADEPSGDDEPEAAEPAADGADAPAEDEAAAADADGEAAADDEDDEAANPGMSDETSADATDMAEDMKENLEGQMASQGGGSATLTMGDQTWEFDSVLCAIGEEETGQEGAEFVLTSLQDGLQFYVSIDSYGHRVTLDDIEDFENPSVSLATVGFPAEDFIELDGKSVRGEMVLTDDLTTEQLDASFEGTCP
ncbi:hypothetical protein MWU75_18895 [Ornithinimicrobium sp. F0845]|uniref:hypothetical protein n=1 Tax=Ornithinimicrobium sp. F0845 TaxID=2926412 RepID=UPI001FF1B5BB|nr:hypothetical protein [Ornithinimicrobium sp. F0845]MCK0114211.1 hypothetical protein [Ornithinimicrobium sp. F0845]